jgi:hypothetical protein
MARTKLDLQIQNTNKRLLMWKNTLSIATSNSVIKLYTAYVGKNEKLLAMLNEILEY